MDNRKQIENLVSLALKREKDIDPKPHREAILFLAGHIGELQRAYTAMRQAEDNAEKWDLKECLRLLDHMDALVGYEREV